MARKYLTRRANQRHYSIITPSVLQTSTVKFAGESETFSRSEERAFARLEGWKSALVLRDGARAPPQHEGLQTSPLNLHHLPRLERAKTLARNFRLIQRRAQRDDRRLDRFIRQLKGAVVMHQRHRDAVAKFNPVMPVERFGLDRAVGALHGDVVAERRDHAAGEFRG